MKDFSKIFLTVLAIFLFTGCSDKEMIGMEQVKVKIVDIIPPKRFYIVVETKESSNQKIYITKRCTVKDGLINSETTITKKTYRSKTGELSYTYEQFLPDSEYCR